MAPQQLTAHPVTSVVGQSGSAPRFGVARVAIPGRSAMERFVFRMFGIIDPAHYLHYRYVEQMLDMAPPSPTRVLDAGCGRGDFSIYLAQRFPGAEVLGLDLNPSHVKKCALAARQMNIPNLSFTEGNLAELDRPESFDVILSVDVLEHIPEQKRAVEALRRALRPGGVLIVHIPTKRPQPVPFERSLRDFLDWAADEHLAEERTAEQFLDVLSSCGFQILHSRKTFARPTGELAVSLFNVFYRPTRLNQLLQGMMGIPCRLLAKLDLLGIGSPHYALAVVARRPDTSEVGA